MVTYAGSSGVLGDGDIAAGQAAALNLELFKPSYEKQTDALLRLVGKVMLLRMSPHTTLCVLILVYMFSYYYMCPDTPMCDLILL